MRYFLAVILLLLAADVYSATIIPRRGTTAQLNNTKANYGEIATDSQTNYLRVYDGQTMGGFILYQKPVSSSVYINGGDISLASTAFIDVAGTTLTVTMSGNTRLLIGVSVSGYNNTNAAISALDIAVDNVRQGGSNYGLVVQAPAAGGDVENFSFTYITSVLSAGSHSIRLMGNASAGALVLKAGTGGASPLVFWCQEIY